MEKARLLVVEDEALVALWLKERLETLGYDVPATAQGRNDVERFAADTRPDLVLMDIRLKGGADGIDLASWLEEKYHVPIVFVSAHSDPQTIERAKKTSPFGFITKPVNEKDLKTAVEVALFKARRESALSEERKAMESVLNAIPEAIISCDLLGVVTLMNLAAAQLLDVPPTISRHRSITSLLKLADLSNGTPVPLPLEDVILNGVTVVLDEVLVVRGESEVKVACTFAPQRNRGNSLTGVIVTVHGLPRVLPSERE